MSLKCNHCQKQVPIALISKLIDKLQGATYFTKLDVCWGFNNVQMKEGDEWKAAFQTNQGLYEPLVMFFGLTNSPATFQTMMDRIFEDLISEGIVMVYLCFSFPLQHVDYMLPSYTVLLTYVYHALDMRTIVYNLDDTSDGV